MKPDDQWLVNLAKNAELARNNPGEDISGLSDKEFLNKLFPDHYKDFTMKPDVSNYTSDRVFDGVRVLTQKQREEHLARLKKAREKRNNGK
jgi:hypothetical protein